MDKKIKLEYMVDPSFCPECKSLDITYTGSAEDSEDLMYRAVSCVTCGAQWAEEYKFTNVFMDGEDTEEDEPLEQVIPDHLLLMTWECPDYDESKPEELGDHQTAEVNPDYYQDNGTPQCSCGEDMIYIHTTRIQ
jgi:hypothetical protein